ncbi:MAG: hypothetical protein J6X53_08780, partial [Abditibacteriota bacterium]|nr:hypothetical protein [Abditibacteriota bacterium]
MLTGFKAFDLLSDDEIVALSSYQKTEGARNQTAGISGKFENFFERTQDDFVRNKENRGRSTPCGMAIPGFRMSIHYICGNYRHFVHACSMHF